MSDSDENTQGNTLDRLGLLKWLIRYVVMPFTLAVIAGLFALAVAFIAGGYLEKLLQPPSAGVSVGAVNSPTATAVTSISPTPTHTPTTVPTQEPTSTQEATTEGTDNPESEDPVVDPPPFCGQVPTGWQIYVVQRGNTLYSLARNNGTTIDAIRQANCLNGQLIAGVPIWLPNIEPEPPTEPIALPDLINITEDMPTVSVDCSMRVACVTIVSLTVGNVGSVAAGSFNVQVMLDPAQSVVLNQSIEFLGPSETEIFPLTIPPSVNCSKGCTVFIIVDSDNVVVEDNEGNNQVEITFLG